MINPLSIFCSHSREKNFLRIFSERTIFLCPLVRVEFPINASTKLTFDYQFIANPGYNADRGPANVFAARAHWQF